jgi:hypothetical protein
MVSVSARPRARRARVPAPRGAAGRPTPLGGDRLRRHLPILPADPGALLRSIGGHAATGPAPFGGSRPPAGIRPDRGLGVAGCGPARACGTIGSIPGPKTLPSLDHDPARRGSDAEGGSR